MSRGVRAAWSAQRLASVASSGRSAGGLIGLDDEPSPLVVLDDRQRSGRLIDVADAVRHQKPQALGQPLRLVRLDEARIVIDRKLRAAAQAALAQLHFPGQHQSARRRGHGDRHAGESTQRTRGNVVDQDVVEASPLARQSQQDSQPFDGKPAMRAVAQEIGVNLSERVAE
jgi:hypothetical protein